MDSMILICYFLHWQRSEVEIKCIKIMNMFNSGLYGSSYENKQHPHSPSLITNHRISVFHGPVHGNLDMCVIALEGNNFVSFCFSNPNPKNKNLKILKKKKKIVKTTEQE